MKLAQTDFFLGIRTKTNRVHTTPHTAPKDQDIAKKLRFILSKLKVGAGHASHKPFLCLW
jgi:hypothetical protein